MKDQGESMENPPVQRANLSFQDLRKLEFAIAAELNKLRDYALDLKLGVDVTMPIEDALQRIQSHSFAIAVVGEFKRGKSTFINALLGQEILPADIAPTSATLNRVTYGTRPTVRIVFKPESGGEEQLETIGVDQLANYVTKLTPEAEAMAAKVKEAIVYYPSRFCQNNVSIIDTPGLSDDVTMTEITLSVLPKVDAAILVIMPESPFSGSEGKFLSEHLLHTLEHVFFVVTAVDRLRRSADQEKVLNLVVSRIETAIKQRAAELFQPETQEHQDYLKHIGKPKVFGLSGYNALHGKLENNPELIAASGIHAFETALEKFLTEERGMVTLKVAAERLQATSIAVDAGIRAQHTAVQTQQAAFDAACTAALAKLTTLREAHPAETRAVQLAPERIYARLQSALELLVEQLNGVAEKVIDEAQIVYTDLNQASVGAVGKMLGNLGNQVPTDVQSSVRKGWGKLLERLPSNVQETSQDVWKKVVDKVPENVQNLGKAPTLEQLVQQLTMALQTAGELKTPELRGLIQQGWFDVQTDVVNYSLQVEQTIRSIMNMLVSQEYAVAPETVAAGGEITVDLSLFATLDKLDVNYEQLGLKAAAMSKVGEVEATGKKYLTDIKKVLNQSGATEPQASVDSLSLFKNNLKRLLAEETGRQLAPHLEQKHLVSELTEALHEPILRLMQQLDSALAQIRQTEQALSNAKQRSTILAQRKYEELAQVRHMVAESGTIGAQYAQQLAGLLGA